MIYLNLFTVVLVPWLLGWPNPGLAFDAMLHMGTLLAVLAIFWPDLCSLAAAWWDSLRRFEFGAADATVAWWILLGTIPAALMGVLWEEQFEALFHSPLHVSALLLVTSLWLALAERLGDKKRQPEGLHWWQSLLVGLAQGGAIAPGISRSGATIASGSRLPTASRVAVVKLTWTCSIPGRRSMLRSSVNAQLAQSMPSICRATLDLGVCIRSPRTIG